jgi:hypothetical protein
VGLGTFIDPRLDGGKLNKRTREDLVRLMGVDGKEWLFYKAMPLNVALLRGTTADPEGNVTAERECLDLDNLAMAMAVKNSGGIVIVQVERIAKSKTLNPRDVLIPGPMVDCVVVAEPANHHQTYGTVYDAAFSGEIAVPLDGFEPTPLDVRKALAVLHDKTAARDFRGRLLPRGHPLPNLLVSQPPPGIWSGSSLIHAGRAELHRLTVPLVNDCSSLQGCSETDAGFQPVSGPSTSLFRLIKQLPY